MYAAQSQCTFNQGIKELIVKDKAQARGRRSRSFSDDFEGTHRGMDSASTETETDDESTDLASESDGDLSADKDSLFASNGRCSLLLGFPISCYNLHRWAEWLELLRPPPLKMLRICKPLQAFCESDHLFFPLLEHRKPMFNCGFRLRACETDSAIACTVVMSSSYSFLSDLTRSAQSPRCRFGVNI